jgi:hypothetical protein
MLVSGRISVVVVVVVIAAASVARFKSCKRRHSSAY